MGIRSSQGWNPYDSSGRKTFKSALCHLLHTEFPGIFGPTISGLFADKIDELFEQFHPPRSRFKAGQVLWTGVAIDDPPSRDKRIEHTRLVPVVLDLVAVQDIETAKAKERRSITRGTKIVRLFRQAYEQGAVLGHADVSLLLNMSISRLSAYVISHERATGELIPRGGPFTTWAPQSPTRRSSATKRSWKRSQPARLPPRLSTAPRTLNATFSAFGASNYAVTRDCHRKRLPRPRATPHPWSRSTWIS